MPPSDKLACLLSTHSRAVHNTCSHCHVQLHSISVGGVQIVSCYNGQARSGCHKHSIRHAHVSNVYGDWTGNDESSKACDTCPGACPGTCCQVRTPFRGSHFALLPAGPLASVTSPACPACIIRGPGHSGTLIFAHRAFSGTARRGTLISLRSCTASLYDFLMWQLTHA